MPRQRCVTQAVCAQPMRTRRYPHIEAARQRLTWRGCIPVIAGERGGKQAILWGSLPRQCDCLIVVRSAEAGIAIRPTPRATIATSPAPVRGPPRRTDADQPRQGRGPPAARARTAPRHATSRARPWRSAATRAAAATARHRRRQHHRRHVCRDAGHGERLLDASDAIVGELGFCQDLRQQV